jgi:hypothetical protein
MASSWILSLEDSPLIYFYRVTSWRTRSPYFCPPETGWPSYTPGHRVDRVPRERHFPKSLTCPWECINSIGLLYHAAYLKFRIPSPIGSLWITSKPTGKYRFHEVAILFYVPHKLVLILVWVYLHSIDPNQVSIFGYRTSSRGYIH